MLLVMTDDILKAVILRPSHKVTPHWHCKTLSNHSWACVRIIKFRPSSCYLTRFMEMLSDLTMSLSLSSKISQLGFVKHQLAEFKTVSHKQLSTICVRDRDQAGDLGTVPHSALWRSDTRLMALVFVTFHSSDRFIPRRPEPDTHGAAVSCCNHH